MVVKNHLRNLRKGKDWLLYIDDVHNANEILDELGDLAGLAGADGQSSTHGRLLFTSRNTVRWPPEWDTTRQKIACFPLRKVLI